MSESDTDIEERRQTTPVTQVAITRHEDGDECLYIGQLDPESTQFRQIWDAENGDGKESRVYKIVAVVETPTAMTIEEALEWVKSAPDAVTEHLNHELPEDIGASPGIGLKEYYTAHPPQEGEHHD